MHPFTILSVLPALSGIVTCSPLLKLQPRQGSVDLPSFLLVTTTSKDPPPGDNSSALPSVSATSLFDPYEQSTYLLRLIAPGYGSLPIFNISGGTLHTEASGLNPNIEYEYNSTTVQANAELGFDASPEASGNLALERGYLLTVDGECEGWTVCEGELEEQVIYWKGTGPTCVARYIQAVVKPPY